MTVFWVSDPAVLTVLLGGREDEDDSVAEDPGSGDDGWDQLTLGGSP